MSRLLSEEEYRKTKAFRVKRWYHGEKYILIPTSLATEKDIFQKKGCL